MAARPRRILVGYDGSEAGSRALDAAQGREQLQRRHVEARYHQPSGEPAEQLVEAARELEANLVVVGRRDCTPLRGLLGSVSGKVVRRVPCDVLVVR